MNRRLVPETNGRKRRQIYRENEVFLKKKCAGAYTVLEFICAGSPRSERPYGHRLRPGRNGRKRHRFIGKSGFF